MQSEPVALITEDFYRNLRRLGNAPGLGFYIPEEDPKSSDRDKANLGEPGVVPFAGGIGRTALPRPGNVPGFTQPGDEETIANPDPVTGEDMSTDWKFNLGFKIKLGEVPEGEAQAKESEGD